MRVIFMGTPQFAVPCLERLIQDGHDVVLAICQADKPKGRGYALTAPPVKQCAVQHGIPVFQPEKIKNNPEAVRIINECNADVAIVVAYGKILPREVLDIPRFGCINIHASLLPKYRGAAPIQHAVLDGMTRTGVTSMLLDEGMDTGDMLLRREVEIPGSMTAGQLFDILMEQGAQLLSDTMVQLESGRLTRIPQNEGEASHAPMLDRGMSPIDWRKNAEEIHNQVRGLNPWPGAVTEYNGIKLKIHLSQIAPPQGGHSPGTIISLSPFAVACGNDTVLQLLEVQGEGARRMSAEDFANGKRVKAGEVLKNSAMQ